MFWLLRSVFSPGRPAPPSRGCISRVAVRPRSNAPSVRGSGFWRATGRVAGRRRRLPRGHGARVVSSASGCWSNGFGRSMTVGRRIHWTRQGSVATLSPGGRRRSRLRVCARSSLAVRAGVSVGADCCVAGGCGSGAGGGIRKRSSAGRRGSVRATRLRSGLRTASCGCVCRMRVHVRIWYCGMCGFPPFGSPSSSRLSMRAVPSLGVKLLRRGKVQLCVTFDEPEPELVSDPAAGAVGVDLNRNHLAVVDVALDGRVAGAVRLALRAGSDAVWRVAKAVVARARRAGRPVVLENLDFRSDKAWLRSYSERFAEVLSIFRSRQVRDAVEREGRRAGVEVRYVDPAWTSELGSLKYRRRCRLGRHHAAALVIGRRGLGFGERLLYGRPTLTRTVECVGTSVGKRVFVQRLPAAWLQGGRRRHDRRGRAPRAPVAGSGTSQPDGPPAGDGSPAAVGGA